MNKQTKLDGLGQQGTDIDASNSLVTYSNRPSARSYMGSNGDNTLNDTGWYPEQYNVGFIAYPR